MYRRREATNFRIAVDVPHGDHGFPALCGCVVDQLSDLGKTILWSYHNRVEDPSDCGLHFFTDDYRLERIWADPFRFAEAFRPFRYVMLPDFSIFTDMAPAMQDWNFYRSRLLGSIFESYGIPVIPTA